MAAIGDIVTGNDIKDIQAYMNKSIRSTAYVAPTVFRFAASKVTSWIYYKTFEQAYSKYLIVNGTSTKEPPVAGHLKFTNEAKAQTLGINVDFFAKIPMFSNKICLPYAFIRQYIPSYYGWIIIRFYKISGEGPFYTIVHTSDFSAAATRIDNIPADKIDALDNFHRSLQILKSHHNALVNWLTSMSNKTLSPLEQKYFNQGSLMLNNMRQQIGQIKGIEVNYGKSGAIGLFGIDDVILGIVVVASIITWGIVDYNRGQVEVEKVIKNNDAIKFQSSFQLEVEKAYKAGLITKEARDSMISNSQQQQQQAADNNTNLSKDKPGILDQVMNLAKWGLAFYGVKILADNFGSKKS